MIEAFIWFNISFFVRMVIIFTIMMKYYHWVDKEGRLWKVTEVPWQAIAAVFFVLDIIYNWVMALYLADLPRVWDETVTNRMARYLRTEKGFKLAFAKLMRKVLNYSDPGHL